MQKEEKQVSEMDQSSTGRQRDDRMDNIKGILMLLVVFGHLLELVLKDNSVAHMLYTMIYMFHMPLFIFTTGYFAKGTWRKVCCHMIYPYLVFQTLYSLFAGVVLHSKTSLDYGTPYWLLWYLFATVIWTGTEPLWNRHKWQKLYVDICILTGAFVVALVCGNWSFVGRDYSLSRILVFFPFFMAGAYTRKWGMRRSQKDSEMQNASGIEALDRVELRERIVDGSGHFVRLLLLFMTAVSLLLIAFHHQFINRNWLYEATSYETSHYQVGFRLIHLLVGLLVVGTCMLWIPNRRWKGMHTLGTHTMQIFLLHGFLIKLLEKHHAGEKLMEVLQVTENGWIFANITAVMILLITAVGITFLLSLPVVTRLMKPFTSCDFFFRKPAVK